MAFYFLQDEARQVLYTKIIGEAQTRELLAYYRAMILKGFIGAGRRELLDGRDISHVAVDLEGQEAMAGLAEENSHVLKHMRSALVATKTGVYGVFRQYQLMVGTYQRGLRVYQRMDEALAYLDIPEAEAESNLNRVSLFS
jgi:hypothetical protein